MNYNTNQQTGPTFRPAQQPQAQTAAGCGCGGTTPAPQPKPPPASGTECDGPKPGKQPPKLEDPAQCPRKFDCPHPPTSAPGCIDTLIGEQTSTIAEAERATKFKAELILLLDRTKAAQAEYTLEKYQVLLDKWKTQDARIVKLIEKLVCAVKCWQCQTECQVCALFNHVRDLNVQLNGTGASYDTVDSLYDLQYWLQRDLVARQAVFDRVNGVLTAWQTPAATLEKILNDDAELIRSAEQFLDPEAARLLYTVFIKLVPMHLSVAPPADVAVTGIDKKYTELCMCDTPQDPDDCCGPDLAIPPLRMQLLGPQPYLLHPDRYMALICCLVEKRLTPAKIALATTEGKLMKVGAEIERVKGEIDSRIKSIEPDAALELGKPFDCDACKPATATNGENHHA